MVGDTDGSTDTASVPIDDLPDGLGGGSTVLIAGTGDPSQYALALRVLRRFGTPDDTALVVTTTESADRTIETYERSRSETDGPSIGIVDTTSERQSVSAVYGEIPVIFTPSPGDLERLVLALSDLCGTHPPSNVARHLVVRSLTPILDRASTARVCTVLDRITGLRSVAGLCLLGLDYTAHDESTMAAVTAQVDGVLWVTRSASNRLEFDFRPARHRYSR